MKEDPNVFEFVCICSDPYKDHLVRVMRDTEDLFTDGTVEYYMSSQLNHYASFWKRLCIAFKYVLGIDNTYCHYTESIISQKQMNEFVKFIQVGSPIEQSPAEK